MPGPIEPKSVPSRVPSGGFRIDHRNLQPFLDQLQREPYFQCGSSCRPRGWYRRLCWLVLANGELAEGMLKTLALAGRENPVLVPIPKNARLNAHGLEGVCLIRKPLFNALMNLRDIVPEYRGYIVCDERPDYA